MEFRCDITGSWHFFSNCPINPLMVIFRERLPHKFEVCGQCKTHKHRSESTTAATWESV